jgi:hypothetical protein
MRAVRTILLLALVLMPRAAAAVSVRDIIELSKAGLSDDILVAVIEADRTIFTLDKDEILRLRAAGVSEVVILKMLRTRVEELQAAEPVVAPAPPPVYPPVAPIDTPMATPPSAQVTVTIPQYFVVPYAIWGTPGPRVPAQPVLAHPYRGFGRFINDGWVDRR